MHQTVNSISPSKEGDCEGERGVALDLIFVVAVVTVNMYLCLTCRIKEKLIPSM